MHDTGPDPTVTRDSALPSSSTLPPDVAPPSPPPDTEPSTGRRARPRRKPSALRRLLFYGFLLAASFVIGVQIFNLVIMPAFVGHRDQVKVPDLAGKDLAAAEAILTNAGLKLGDTRQRYDTQPAGTIVDQHPVEGSLVKAGRTVALIVSRGESGGLVPGLFGQTLRTAKLSIESAGLSLGEIVRVPSETVPKDGIVATEPAAGSAAPKGAPVNLLISLGGSGAAYVMPDLRGRDVSEAEEFLKGAGFTVQVEGGGGFFRSRRTVTDTSPAAGARLVAGSQVTLIAD